MAFVVLCIAQFMLIVDVVVLNVALPSIQDGLGIPTGQLQLAGVAYTVTFGSLLIVAGRAGDVFGRRRVFRVGLCVFTLASALAALSQVGWHLFAARALQGVGAALVSPTALALVTSLFDGERRNRAMGVWAAIGSGGAIAGQLLGGVLTDTLGWQSIFLINLPFGLAGVLLAGRLLTESRDDEQRPALDVWGAALLAAGVAAFSVALTGVLVLALVAVPLLAGFWWHERRRDEPLLRFALLRDRSVWTGNTVLAILAGTTATALFFTTLYLQGVLDYSAMQVGLAFAPVTVIVLVVSPFAGRVVGRLGARPLIAAGTVLSTVGMVLLSALDPAGSYVADVLPGLTLVALGNGMAFAPTMITATSVPAAHSGVASGLLNTSQELGTAVGLATLAPIAVAVTATSTLPAAITSGYRAGLLVAAGMLVLAMIVTSRVPKAAGVVKVSAG